MSSVSDLIALSEYKRQEQERNEGPGWAGALSNVVRQALGGMNQMKQNEINMSLYSQQLKNRKKIMDLIDQGEKAGKNYSWEADENGNVKLKYAPKQTEYDYKTINNRLAKINKDTQEIEFIDTPGGGSSSKPEDNKRAWEIAAQMAKGKYGKDLGTYYAPTTQQVAEFMPQATSMLRTGVLPSEGPVADQPNKQPQPAYDPANITSWKDVPVLQRLLAAVTPSSTTEEKKLGGLRPGGVLNAPKTKGDASLPSNIKTTTQAIDHLMKNYKMSKQEAIEWLKSQ